MGDDEDTKRLGDLGAKLRYFFFSPPGLIPSSLNRL